MPGHTAIIPFGGSWIAYRLRRSDRKKTVNIAVDPGGEVIVTAPDDLDTARVHRIVRRKAGWIAQRLRELRETNRDASPHEFVSGESFPYLGRSYRLKVIPCSATHVPLRLVRGRFEVTVERGLSATARSAAIRSALSGWYRDHAAQRIPERAAILSPRLGMLPPPLLVREQQKRWASCDRQGRIRVNWCIIMAPMSLVDYVEAHELCHLSRPDHSPAFWQLLRTVLPDYEARRERLRREGARFWL